MREVYEIRGYDFALCCAINSMYDLEFGENLTQRLSGLVDLGVKIDRVEKRPDKKVRIKKWKGKIKGLDEGYVTISEVKGYLTRVCLDFRPQDADEMPEIRAILRGISVRAHGKRTLAECRIDLETKLEDKKPVNNGYLGSCGIYSSD